MPVEELNTLIVSMLGGFSMRYNGKELSIGNLSGQQMVQFLQLLLHYRKQGVSRDLAKSVLFGDRDVDDISHSIRNIIYNLRKKLKELGLPESQYVVKRKGIYYWADDIPVKEDAGEFDDAFDLAMEEEDDEKRMIALNTACYKYKGRFLYGHDSAVWIVQEGERYREMFADCVSELAAMLRDEHMYKRMYDLGKYATKVDPFSEWELVTLEALSGLGKFDETESFYRQTVDAYTGEYGGRANTYVREFVNRLGLKLVVGNESLEEIQHKIGNDHPLDNSGYYTSLPAFQEIYRMTERMMERAGEKIYLMLCTILDSKGNPMREGARLEELADRLKDTIVTAVRRTDTVTRYGKGQFLILLINITYEDCAIVAERINAAFIRNGQRTSVRYSVNNVIVSAYPQDNHRE